METITKEQIMEWYKGRLVSRSTEYTPQYKPPNIIYVDQEAAALIAKLAILYLEEHSK